MRRYRLLDLFVRYYVRKAANFSLYLSYICFSTKSMFALFSIISAKFYMSITKRDYIQEYNL